ncbi:MAG: DsbA family oxidoreductase [Solirubrobacterales bacterium]|nr:DsbA family oxidoreductase [Solirubrobacterales bacterium]
MDVEIWSDIACPWCYVGKRRFEAALSRFEHRDAVSVTYRSFELDPSAPAERTGGNAQHLAAKYGMSLEQAQGKLDEMTRTAAEDGLEFRFDRARGGNTFDGHRLLHLAAEHGVQDAAKERLMRAYLTDGELISDHATLQRVGEEIGLDAEEVGAMLASDRFADAVRADEETARGFGIQGVPFFVVDRAMGASGAHPPEALLQLLEQGWAARGPEPLAVVAEGDSCGVDGC